MIHMDDSMEQDDPYAEDVVATQETQDPSQPVSSQAERESNEHLWGYLIPCRESLNRVDFWKETKEITFGRSNENIVILPSLKISNKHCTLTWDGVVEGKSVVLLTDFSSNGTFINNSKVGRGKTAVLRDGNELAFGSAGKSRLAEDDYRYIFRHLAPGSTRSGLYLHYDMGVELGKGTFATVYSAVKRDTGQWYAVKVIQRSRFRPKNDDSREMFMREITILQSLDHPNICRLIEKFVTPETISLVLEYIDGGDLLEYIISNDGLLEDHSKYLTIQLCSAIAHIHEQGVAHRDLKPENILLTKTNPPILKVADFGLAKAVNSMTQFKTTCGTPNYLAPEVILRNANECYDEVVDSWSVGVIVFAMLTNAVPFAGDDSKLELRERFEVRTIDWRPLYGRGCSDTGIDFVRALLEENPRHRMTMRQALNDVWLTNLRRPYEDSLLWGAAPFEDGPVIQDDQVLDNNGALFAWSEADQMKYKNVSFRKLSLVPGAFRSFASHNASVAMRDDSEIQQPLSRRAMQFIEQDPEGVMQSWELVTPEEQAKQQQQQLQDEESLTPNGNLPGFGNFKWHEQEGQPQSAMAPYAEPDSPLTPASEESHGDAHRAGPSTRSAGGRKRVSDGDGSLRKNDGPTKVAKTGTGANVRRGRQVDDAMEIEQPARGAIRQSARLASPNKRT